MKIGIDCRLWNETGVGRYIRNLVWNLQNLDKKNCYVLFVKKDIANHELNIENDPRWKIVHANIRWHSFEEQIKFPGILYKENLDLMHFPYFSMPFFYKKPFVVTIHDLIINHFPTGRASTLPLPVYYAKRFAYNYLLKHSVKDAKTIIVPLNAVKEDVITTLGAVPEQIAVTYEGVENRRNKKLNIKNTISSPYFLYVGNAYPHKNLKRLMEAFISFKKDIKDEVKLLLVGKNDYFYKKLEEEALDKGNKDIVFQHGVDDRKLFSLYAHAKAFVSASLMEGFGLPSLEAMSASCLVLVSDIPSFREVCQNVGFYFDPYNIDAIKKQLRFVYNLDYKTKQKLIVRGLNRVNDFSWRKMAEETLRIYESSLCL